MRNAKFLKPICAMVLAPLISLILFSCSTASDEGKTTTAGGGSGQNEPGETTTDAATPELPEKDFGGYVFRMYTCLPIPDATNLMDAEQILGEPLNDAIYKANREIEERFGIAFKQTEIDTWDKMASILDKSVAAGDDVCDMINIVDRDVMSLLAKGKCIYSIGELPYIDPSKEYWNQKTKELYTIAGKSYFLNGANMLNYIDTIKHLVYNKQIAQDNGIENIYNLVREGKWTMDKMFDIAKSVTRDINGDGIMDDNDLWGIIAWPDEFYPAMWADIDNPLVKKGEDGLPYFNVPGNMRLTDIFNKLYDRSNEGGLYDTYVDKKSKFANVPAHYSYVNAMFSEGHGLFASSAFRKMLAFRDMEADYGIVPYPTYEEKKPGEPYNGYAATSMIFFVPVVNPDPERVSIIMEAQAAGFYKYVIPAYYDIIVREKLTRDDESRDMLDMLYKNAFSDMADTIFIGVRGQYAGLFRTKSNTIASHTEKIADSIDTMLEKAIAAFQEPE